MDLMFENFPGWKEARPARAPAPQGDPEALRKAYLELLKLCLCDLGGTTTASVGKREDGRVASRELRGEELRLRSAGMDWPLQGLSMVGLSRLDDLQSCCESIVRDGVEGDLIEAGSWRGGASILMRATLDTLGAEGRTVWVADSFEGFPTADTQEHLNVVDFLSVPLEEVRANFARFGLDDGVRFVPGFFEETMSGLIGRQWAIARLDGDTYEATWLTLESLYPGVSVGGYLIVDDYGALHECRRAVDEFRERYGITEPLEKVDWTGVRWRRSSDAEIRTPDSTADHAAAPPTRSVASVDRPRTTHVPTERELELADEASALRTRLEAAEAEIERLRRSPVAGPRAWLGGKVRGMGGVG